MATDQAIAAPRIPSIGISTMLRPTLTASATTLLPRLCQLRPAISSAESTEPHRVASNIVSDRMTTTSEAAS